MLKSSCWRKCSPYLGRKAGLRPVADSVRMRAHVLAKIRALNRVLCVWETMRAAMDSLAVVTPEWLRSHSQPEWVERYGPRSEESRVPVGEEARLAFAEEIGRQGRALLDALFDPTAPEWLRQVPAGAILRRVW